MPGPPAAELLYLTQHEVALALEGIDPVEVATRVAREHAAGRTLLPDEAYLGWTTAAGARARSLSMPGMLTGAGRAAGVKVINASLGNSALGLPRADGLTVLFDVETARPLALMDAALVSATRTAAVSVLALRTFADPPPQRLAIIGCGRQARAHLELTLRHVPSVEHVSVHDERAPATRAFLDGQGELASAHGAELAGSASAAAAMAEADAVVLVTTVTEGYVEPAWLKPDALVVHVSLDDLLPDVVLGAGLVVVDDWELVKADHRRLFGRMYREGLLCGPGETVPGARSVDGELGEFLAQDGARARRRGLVVVNPFGMAIHDVALAERVLASATERGLGTRLAR